MKTSQQIIIRGIDQATMQGLQAHADHRGVSLNAYILELLRQAAGASQTNGLERFAGIGPLDPEVEEALADQRQPTIDKWDSYGL
jgi:predicted metal-dependent hydrolase